jgi:N-acetylneuraminic acid mutarotase
MTRLCVAIALLAIPAAACGGSPDDGWRMLAASPLSPRDGQVAVWTGEQMLVLGGGNLDVLAGPNDRRRRAGYSFDPSTGRTTQLVEERFADGAAYDPTADRWDGLPPAPTSARAAAAALWTGDEALVWGGVGDLGEPLRDGGAFSPAERKWRSIASWLERR